MPEGSRNGISAEKNTEQFLLCNDEEDDEDDENLRLKKFSNVNFIFDLFRAAISMEGNKNGSGEKNSFTCGKDSQFVMLVLSQKQKENSEINLLIDRLRQNGVTCIFFNGNDIRNGTSRLSPSELSEVGRPRQRQPSVEEKGKSSSLKVITDQLERQQRRQLFPSSPESSHAWHGGNTAAGTTQQDNKHCSLPSQQEIVQNSLNPNRIIDSLTSNGTSLESLDSSDKFNGIISIPIISPNRNSPSLAFRRNSNKILVAPKLNLESHLNPTPSEMSDEGKLSEGALSSETKSQEKLSEQLQLDLNPKEEESPITQNPPELPPQRKKRRKRRKYPYLTKKPIRKKNIWKDLEESELNSSKVDNSSFEETIPQLTLAQELLSLEVQKDLLLVPTSNNQKDQETTLTTSKKGESVVQKNDSCLTKSDLKTKGKVGKSSKKSTYRKKKDAKRRLQHEDAFVPKNKEFLLPKIEVKESLLDSESQVKSGEGEASEDPYAFDPESEDEDLSLSFGLSPKKPHLFSPTKSPNNLKIPPKGNKKVKKSVVKKGKKKSVTNKRSPSPLIVKLKGLQGFSPEVTLGHQVSKRTTNNSTSSSLFRTPEKIIRRTPEKLLKTKLGTFSPDITNDIGFRRPPRSSWRNGIPFHRERSVSMSSSPSEEDDDDDDEDDFLPGRIRKGKKKTKKKKTLKKAKSKVQITKKSKKCVQTISNSTQEDEQEIPVLVKESELNSLEVAEDNSEQNGQFKDSPQLNYDEQKYISLETNEDDAEEDGQRKRKLIKLDLESIGEIPLLKNEMAVVSSEIEDTSKSVDALKSTSSVTNISLNLPLLENLPSSSNIQENKSEEEIDSLGQESEKRTEEPKKGNSGVIIKIGKVDAEALRFKFPPDEETNGREEEDKSSFMEAMQLRRPSFYSQISGNVRNNLENHLDGRSSEGNQSKMGKRRKRARNGFLLHHGDNFPEDPEAPYKLHLATQIILKLNKRRSKFKPKVENRKSLLSYLKLVPKRSSRAGKGSPLSVPQDEEPPLNEEPEVTSVFSGEWIQERNFICNVCGHVEDYFWNMVHHKGEVHPGVVVTHVELPDLPPVGFRVPPPVPNSDVLPPPPQCTKCNSSFTTYPDLHRHIFECAGNSGWLEEIQPEPQPQPKKKPKRKRGFNSFKRRLSNTPKKKSDVNCGVKRRGGEVFKCEFCTREFKTEGWLKNHLVTHSLPISIPLEKLTLPPRASSSSPYKNNYSSRRSCLHNLIAAAAASAASSSNLNVKS